MLLIKNMIIYNMKNNMKKYYIMLRKNIHIKE
jgi:hypothetical protein